MGPFWKKSISGSTSAFAAGEKHLSGLCVYRYLGDGWGQRHALSAADSRALRDLWVLLGWSVRKCMKLNGSQKVRGLR
jgi:hypothetical protein